MLTDMQRRELHPAGRLTLRVTEAGAEADHVGIRPGPFLKSPESDSAAVCTQS